jgi:hypothetical protein
VEEQNVELIKHIYDNATSVIMLKELNVESKKEGLKMHMEKAMLNKFAEVKDFEIENQIIENVNKYVYLGALSKMEC